MSADDILVDVAERLVARGVDARLAESVLSEVRAHWGGSQIYLRLADPAREVEIHRRLRSGDRPHDVARALGVSVSTVRRRKSTWL